MKKRGNLALFLVLFLVLAGILMFFGRFVSAGVFSDSNLNDKLLSYWNFDDDMKDSMGIANGSCTSCPTITETSAKGKAYSFNGNNQAINTNYNFGWSRPQSFTVSLWYKPASITENVPRGLFGHWCNGWFSCLNHALLQWNGEVYFYRWTSDPYVGDSSSASSVLNTANFSHLIFIYNSSENKLYIYINGTQKSSKSLTFADFFSDSGNSYIGLSYGTGGNVYSVAYANGIIDEFGIWNRSLSSSEVLQLYNSYFVQPTSIPQNITSANFTQNGNIISSYVLGSIPSGVNLSVSGTNLTSLIINYTIYNSSNSIILSVQHTSKNESWDFFDWTPSVPETYYFNASLKNASDKILSSILSDNLIVSNYPLQYRNVSCNGTAPSAADHKVINSLHDVNYTQIWNGAAWNPAEKNWSYNTNVGECNFNCSGGYSWNGSSCNIIRIEEYCYQLKEADCKSAGYDFAIREFDYFNTFNADLCGKKTNCANDDFNYSVKCLCKWDSLKNCTAVSNFSFINKCKNSAPDCASQEDILCSFTSNITNNNCNNSINTIEVAVTASWDGTGNCRPAECADKTAVYQCIATAKLAFFDSRSFIVSLILIAAIYFIICLRQKK